MSKPVLSDLFTLSGRRNRKSYFFYTLLFFIVLIILWTIALTSGDFASENSDIFFNSIVVVSILTIPLEISAWIVGGQRCRDFGWTGWAILLVFLPIFGWAFFIAVLCIPGNRGRNRYGPDPLGNETDA